MVLRGYVGNERLAPIDCLAAVRVAVAGELLALRRDTAAPRLPCRAATYSPNRPPRPTRQWLAARRLWSAWAIVSVGTVPSQPDKAGGDGLSGTCVRDTHAQALDTRRASRS
jgi:hypothetical protein